MNNKNLILIGGGGHCRSVIDVAESVGYNVIGVLDVPEEVGNSVLGYKVIGTDDDIPKYVGDVVFMITVGFVQNPNIRVKLFNKVKEVGGKFATIVASTAYVSRYAFIGEGTIVMHNAVVNSNVEIGTNCIINTFSNIEHDAIVGDQSHISTGAMVNGGCKIGKRVFVGSQSVLVNGVDVGDDIIIGAGSVVVKSIYRPGVYVGNPVAYKI